MYVFPEHRQRPIRMSAFSRTSDSSTRALLHSDHSMAPLQVGHTSGGSSLTGARFYPGRMTRM